MRPGWGHEWSPALEIWTEDGAGVRIEAMTGLDEDQTIHLIQSMVQGAYQLGNVVIVGRGGQVILRERPNVLHVRIETPDEARIRGLQAQRELSPSAAAAEIARRDRAAANYLRRFYDVTWTDLALYDILINTRKLDIEAASHLIVSAARRLSQTTPLQ